MTFQALRFPENTALAGPGAEALVISNRTSPFRNKPIGEILVSTGRLSAANLDRSLAIQRGGRVERIGNILIAEGLVDESTLATGLALQGGVRQLRIAPERASAALIDLLGADLCLKEAVLPWRRMGSLTVVATARPQEFARLRPLLEQRLGPVRMALGDGEAIRQTLLSLRGDWLTRRAETRAPFGMSVRRWSARQIGVALVSGMGAVTALAIVAPVTATAAMTLWAVLALAAMTGLRIAATGAVLFAPRAPVSPASGPLPRVSLLVPLLSEAAITAHLIDRLDELDYPADRLEVVLVTEAGDAATHIALADRGLPPQFRLVSVPAGTIRTKPRAMNYALDFCTGDVVGVYDAEDAPEPDQLLKVAAAFAAAPPEVVCLQGQLAFYNGNQNWLSRCFAIDYAAWFRVVLPGLARLGFVIPLGGTTLFFRREALEELGRWDAHNVTEDAELGIRLARRGWRADIVDTVTREEANCRLAPWIRQRARWLKGYALTWAVHMRQPLRLLRDLGLKRFLGVQAMFLGTVSLFLLAPLLWTFWLIPLGFAHPVAGLLPHGVLLALAGFFLMSEAVNIGVSCFAVARPGDRWLLPWVPTTIAYFPLAAVASYRALADIVTRPFFWDKTAHGHSMPRRRTEAVRRIMRQRVVALRRAA